MVRDKTQVKEGIPDLISATGEPIRNDKGKAEILNFFCASVFTEEDINAGKTIPGTLSGY